MRTKLPAACLALFVLLPGCDPKKFQGDPFYLFKFLSALIQVLELQNVPPWAVDLGDIQIACAIAEGALSSAAEGAVPKGLAPDEYASFEASGDEAFGVFGLKRELRHPFRVEVTVGVFDTAVAGLLDGGFAALELDGPEVPLEHFITAGAQPVVEQGTVTLMNVFVATENGNQGQLLLPDASLVDLAMESDGTDVDVFARPHGDEAWQPVASVPRPAPDSVWNPFVGVVGLDAGGALGVDDLFLKANGPSTAVPGSVEAALEDAWNGCAGLLHARNHMDGLPDADAALPELAAALLALESARDTAQALLDADDAGPALKPARKQLGRAAKQGAVALARLESDKTPKSVVKALVKAQLSAAKGLAALRAEALAGG